MTRNMPQSTFNSICLYSNIYLKILTKLPTFVIALVGAMPDYIRITNANAEELVLDRISTENGSNHITDKRSYGTS